MAETVAETHVQAFNDVRNQINSSNSYQYDDPSVLHTNNNHNNQQEGGNIYNSSNSSNTANTSPQQGEAKQNHQYETNGTTAQDGETGIFKLFVGQIPPFTSEETLRNTFSPYGLLTDVVILKDRHTGAHKGCGFVCYNNKTSSDAAIAALGDRVKLPNAKREMIVRYAGERPDEKEYKLYVCMLSRQSTEQEIRAMFEPFGQLTEVFIIRSREGNQSKGAAFVKFTNKDDAQRAVEAIHDRVKDKDAPGLVQVRFAHTKEERAAHLSHVLGTQHALTAQHHAALLRAGQHPLTQSNQAQAAYAPHLHAAAHNFLPFQGLHHLKQFHPQAALYNTQTQPQNNGNNRGANGTQDYATAGQTYGTSFDASAASAAQHYTANAAYYSPPFATSHLQANGLTGSPQSSSASKDPRGPEGANLFVYNIPETYSEVELNTLFSTFGSVLSTRIQRDLQTGVSKGFGFVSYEDPIAAQSAIHSLDGSIIGNKRLTVRVKTQSRPITNTAQMLNMKPY